ncbi:NTP transferase domain-containing protein [Lutimonas sp.]|uniref:NTP transferase domain-containing protein n=1 Tax=Lutimonas sp. TaxID=1872403 RepID=UPI003D9B27EA
MKKHLKHAKLSRRDYGEKATFEIAIVGTKCSIIKELVSEISLNIDGSFKVAYADASHSKETKPPVFDEYTFHHSGDLAIHGNYELNPYTDKFLFNSYDLLFINGNHYPGKNQILILDDEKEASVLKRIDQLDNIAFLINLNHRSRLFPFLQEKYPAINELKAYSIHDLENISAHIKKLVQTKRAALKGLVLAGGKSIRMGTDKGLLDYFGKSQREYSIEMLEKLNLETFLSVRKEQNIEQKNVIEDKFLGLGPFGAICSAFQHNPNTAWLVLATDLPYIDEKLIRQLMDHRDSSKVATAIKGKSKQFPEPLVTIWEPKAYPIMLQFLSQGISCPRKVLINSDVKLVEVDDEFITNVNTPEEFSAVKKDLHK